jgi:TolB-like protein/DNA-binding winged helix-turn-helix (wHTH) protein/Flp pilus assembly protein TadD
MNAREPFILGDWTVDPTAGTLSGSAGERRRLTPKLMDLLVALVQRAGQVATRDELLRDVWGERSAVSDEPLTRAVAEVRRVLGDVRADPSYIETIPKRGYRVVAPVRAAHAGAPIRVSSATAVVPGPPTPVAASEPAAPSAIEPPAPPRARSWVQRWSLPAVLALAAAAIAVTIAVRTTITVRPPGPVTVAVLPFADLSPSSDGQYFADGVHEEIIARLAGIAGLQVASHSTVRPYREAGATSRQVAHDLGVDAVMEGTVRHDAARVRVTAQLIDAATDSHVWAETFDRPLTLENLFDIQAEIAARVAAGLTRSLAVGDATQPDSLPTASLPAYEAFLLGKYHYRRRQPGDMRFAVEQFQSAVNADPSFALAWDWLAYAWNHAGVDLGWTTPARAFPRARAAALRALELDPNMATSSALLGFLRAVYDWEWQQGLAELERAARAAPLETGTVWSYAYVLSLLGRHDEAIAQVRALAVAYPQDGRLKQELAKHLIDAGRFPDAVREANAALAGGAEPGQVRELLGIAALGSGDIGTALDELERTVELQQRAVTAVGNLAAVYARAGRADEARALLADLEARAASEELNAVTLARIYLSLDERDRALTLLEQAAERRQRDVLGISDDPFFVALRGDPRFAAVVVRTGIASARATR